MDENRMFDQQIHDAYERVSLSEEAQERMLGALLAAQAERQNAEQSPLPDTLTQLPVEEKSVSATATVLAGGKREARVASHPRRLPRWLPLAAAAACVFVVVGVIGGVTGGSRTSATMEAEGVAMSAGEEKALSATSSNAELDTGAAGVANDMAADAMGEDEMLAAVPEAAEEAAELQLVDRYPCITLYDETSYTALVDGMYTTEIEAEAVGRLIGVGTAHPFDSDETVACEVFELTDDDAYAVRYEGEESYWYCTRL